MIIIDNQVKLAHGIDTIVDNQIAIAKTIPFKKINIDGVRVK